MARSFPGATDYVANSGFAGVNSSQGTISIWVKPNWDSGDSAVHEFWSFGSAVTATDRPSFQKFLDNNIYVGFVNVTDYRVILADTGLFANGVWAHWAFTYTNGGASALYRNGVQVGTHSGLSTNPASAYHVGINDATGSGSGPSNSSLADFAVWDVVLSAGEISALASGIRPHALDKQTILYLPLDGLASPEPDLSGNANNGTVTGTSSANGPPVALFTPRWTSLSSTASSSGLTIASNATIDAFTQSATLNSVENITSNATIASFTQVATLQAAGPATIASAATISPFTQVATFRAIERIKSTATIGPFTQVATLAAQQPAQIASAATIGAFTQASTLFVSSFAGASPAVGQPRLVYRPSNNNTAGGFLPDGYNPSGIDIFNSQSLWASARKNTTHFQLAKAQLKNIVDWNSTVAALCGTGGTLKYSYATGTATAWSTRSSATNAVNVANDVANVQTLVGMGVTSIAVYMQSTLSTPSGETLDTRIANIAAFVQAFLSGLSGAGLSSLANTIEIHEEDALLTKGDSFVVSIGGTTVEAAYASVITALQAASVRLDCIVFDFSSESLTDTNPSTGTFTAARCVALHSQILAAGIAPGILLYDQTPSSEQEFHDSTMTTLAALVSSGLPGKYFCVLSDRTIPAEELPDSPSGSTYPLTYLLRSVGDFLSSAVGKVRKRHSKRYEITINGVTFIAPSIAALEQKVAAWRLAHPANKNIRRPARSPPGQSEPISGERPGGEPAPEAVPEESRDSAQLLAQAAPRLPQPVFLPTLPPPTLAEGAALLEAQRVAAEAAQALRDAILEASAAREARNREIEADDLEVLQLILDHVA